MHSIYPYPAIRRLLGEERVAEIDFSSGVPQSLRGMKFFVEKALVIPMELVSEALRKLADVSSTRWKIEAGNLKIEGPSVFYSGPRVVDQLGVGFIACLVTIFVITTVCWFVQCKHQNHGDEGNEEPIIKQKRKALLFSGVLGVTLGYLIYQNLMNLYQPHFTLLPPNTTFESTLFGTRIKV